MDRGLLSQARSLGLRCFFSFRVQVWEGLGLEFKVCRQVFV